MRSFLFLLALLVTIAGTILQIRSDLQTEKNLVELSGASRHLDGIRLAVLGDLHATDSPDSLNWASEIVSNIRASSPDLVLLLGDYTSRPAGISNMHLHRERVGSILSGTEGSPVVAVLGNYEVWDDREAWARTLEDHGIEVLQNEVVELTIDGRELCIRGIGDAFTGQEMETVFPDSCIGKGLITITHDPQAVFSLGLEGLVFAAHTHCGQVKIPLFWHLWTPSRAKKEALCGLYTTEKFTLWVTSGSGNSLIPMRFLSKSSWDMIKIQKNGLK